MLFYTVKGLRKETDGKNNMSLIVLSEQIFLGGFHYNERWGGGVSEPRENARMPASEHMKRMEDCVCN